MSFKIIIVSKYVNYNSANSSFDFRYLASYNDIKDIISNLSKFLKHGLLVYVSLTRASTIMNN